MPNLNLPTPNKTPGDGAPADDINLVINAINTLNSAVNNIAAGPQGPQGEPGTPGQNGLAATVNVGNVYAGSPGSYPTVTNSGTPQNAILNFTLPPREASAPVNMSDAAPLPTAQSASAGLQPTASRADHVHAIPANGVVTANITDLNVTTGKIADLAVATGKIANLAVTTAKLDNDSVTTGKIADDAVTNAKIADSAVDNAQLADSAVTSGKIADGTIVNGDINAAAAIDQTKISNLTSDLALKAPLASPTFTGTVVLPSATSIGNVSNTEISYLDGVTSSIQTQIDSRVSDTGDTITGDLVINASGTNAGLTVTQTGTGNALLVNDQSGDTTPFVIDASGNVGVGVSAPTRLVDVNGIIKSRVTGTTADAAEGLEVTNTNAGADARVLMLSGLDNGTAVIRNASTTANGFSFVVGNNEELNIDANGIATFANTVKTKTGSATEAPLHMTQGTLLTTPVAGTIENNANTIYYTPAGATSGRGFMNATHFYSLSATRTLANVNTAQSLFGVGITLAASTMYELEMVFGVSTTGATSNSLGMSFLGTATLTSIGYMVNTTNQATSHVTLSAPSAAYVQTAANTAVTAAVAAATFRNITVKGVVRVNASGTFIPNITYSAAPGAAPVVAINSYIKLTPISASNVDSVGTWA